MTQEELFHEDFEGALTACVARLGGAKEVGVMLRPEYKSEPDKAARWLLACLNTSRDEKLTSDQQFAILRAAKEKGCHVGMRYITQHCGYADAVPIEPEDERAALIRQFNESVKTLEHLSRRIQGVGASVLT